MDWFKKRDGQFLSCIYKRKSKSRILLSEDLAGCAETKARTLTSGKFVQWQKNADKKPKQISIVLNRKLLSHFAGYSFKFKKLGHKDFIYSLLNVISCHWEVGRLIV